MLLLAVVSVAPAVAGVMPPTCPEMSGQSMGMTAAHGRGGLLLRRGPFPRRSILDHKSGYFMKAARQAALAAAWPSCCENNNFLP